MKSSSSAREWQGSWVTSGNPHYKLQAWHIDGDTLTAYDGNEETTMSLTVMAPCMLKLEGDRVTYHQTFAFKGQRRMASGGTGAGVIEDDQWTPCAAGNVYVSKGGDCRVWTRKGLGDRSFEQAECRKEPQRVRVQHPQMDQWTVLEKMDGVLASSLLQKRKRLKAYPSLDEAKAAVDAHNEGGK